MKLASLKGGRDGRLVVVSDDLATACEAATVAPTLQAALDDWGTHESALRAIAVELNAGARRDVFDVDPTHCAAPLPRAFQWCDGSAYLSHMELVRQARGAEMPESFRSDPLMYQGGSDALLGGRDDIALADEAWGIDMEAEVAVIVDDVPMGIGPAAAARHIKLVTILNDVSLRNLIPGELAKGFGFFHAKPATAFAPVVATPDALGDAWDGSKVTADMIVGAGTVSNHDRSRGSACLAEVRTIETIDQGEPTTPFMSFGDRVLIDMRDSSGRSIFGAIDQTLVKYAAP